MIAKNFITKIKKQLFPEIKDWSDPMDRYRNEANVKKLSTQEWFWFHPTAYKLQYYGAAVCNICIFLGLTLLSTLKGWNGIMIVSLLLTIFFAYNLIAKYNKRYTIEGLTYYDIYMREEKPNE